MNNTHYKPYAPKEVKPEKGCFFYGCLTAVVLLIALAIGVGYLVYIGVGYFDQFEKALSEKPSVVTTEYLSSQDEQILGHKLANLKQNLDKGQATSLTLNAAELNTFIKQILQTIPADTKPPLVKIAIKDRLFVNFSMPFDNRYLNGSGEVDIEIGQKEKFRIQNVMINDKPVTGVIADLVQNAKLEDLINIAVSTKGDKTQEDLVSRIESLQVVGTQIIIGFK